MSLTAVANTGGGKYQAADSQHCSGGSTTLQLGIAARSGLQGSPTGSCDGAISHDPRAYAVSK
jgi:hypothetical protein